MDELLFLTFVVPPATLLPPPALEMNTRDAGFTLSRSVAKPKLLKFDARCLYFECASYFAKLNLVRTKFFVRILVHFVKLYLRASLCKILISSFAHKMDFAHNLSVDFF